MREVSRNTMSIIITIGSVFIVNKLFRNAFLFGANIAIHIAWADGGPERFVSFPAASNSASRSEQAGIQ
jgi:hypothetical protein